MTNDEYRLIQADLSNYKSSGKLVPLFCYECGIVEMQPSFMQRFCRYCGAKLESEEQA